MNKVFIKGTSKNPAFCNKKWVLYLFVPKGLRKNEVFRGSLNIILVCITFLIANCGSREVKYNHYREPQQNNLWLDDSTLQVAVTGVSDNLLTPVVEQRVQACSNAEKNIDTELLSLYPNASSVNYKKKIYRTLYINKGECKLIVLISKHNLRKYLYEDNKNP